MISFNGGFPVQEVCHQALGFHYLVGYNGKFSGGEDIQVRVALGRIPSSCSKT